MLKDLLIGAAAILPIVFRAPRHAIERELVTLPMPPALPAPIVHSRPLPEFEIAGPRRSINRHEATLLFCAWMRDWGFVGWYPTNEILECYSDFCAEEWLEEMPRDDLLERFAGAPGVTKERRRLTGTADVHLKRIRREHGERVMLYRVCSHEEMAEAAKAYAVKAAAKAAARKSRKRSAQKAAPAVAVPLKIAA